MLYEIFKFSRTDEIEPVLPDSITYHMDGFRGQPGRAKSGMGQRITGTDKGQIAGEGKSLLVHPVEISPGPVGLVIKNVGIQPELPGQFSKMP